MSPKKRKKHPASGKALPFPTMRSYLNYLSSNKRDTYIFIGFYLVVGILIRYCYPYLEFTPDSGGYINWIYPDFKYGGPRPLGYSYFLYWLKQISLGVGIIFWVQYIIHAITMYWFYTTLLYLFNVRHRNLKYLFLAATLLFIPGIYVANMVLSDSIFTSMTILLVTSCLWLLYSANKLMLLPVLVLLLCLVATRYIGFVFPFIVVPVLFIAFRNKIIPVVATVIMFFLFVGYVQKVKDGTYEDQGVSVFSAFSGWQHANNALHVVPHIDLSEPIVKESSQDYYLQQLDTAIRSSYPINSHLYPDAGAVSYNFIWLDSLPLRWMFLVKRAHNKEIPYYKDWNIVGEKYKKYGNLLIKKYFFKYLRYYIANNAIRACFPPLEVFKKFSIPKDFRVYKIHFRWKEEKNLLPRHDIFRPLLRISPFFYAFYWLLFIASAMFLIMQLKSKKLNYRSVTGKSVIVIGAIIITYAFASIYGAPVNLRFLLPVRVLILGMTFILANHYLSQREKAK